MKLLNQQILKCLRQEKLFAVVTIMNHKGATPLSSGSKMIVLVDRTIYGTIGGGQVESQIIDSSLAMINKKKCCIKKFISDKEPKYNPDSSWKNDLTVLIETFNQSSDLISEIDSIFNTIVDLQQNGGKGFLVSKINGVSKSDFTAQKSFICHDGSIRGSNLIPETLIKAIQEDDFKGLSPTIFNHGLDEFIIEPVNTFRNAC